MPTKPGRRLVSSTLLIFAILASEVSAELRVVHCPIGCPSVSASNDLVIYHLFALSNDPTTKFADWVAYEVDVTNFGESPGRNFKSDPMLPAEDTLETGDYKGANADVDLRANKGHQAPLAAFAGNRYWFETNYLSNITPQHENLNQGPWMRLEGAVRAAVQFRESLYVITGPTYEGSVRKMPNADEEHDVPDGYFKIVYTADGKAVGFWMSQAVDRSADYCDFKKPLPEIGSKIDFALPGALQQSDQLYVALGCATD